MNPYLINPFAAALQPPGPNGQDKKASDSPRADGVPAAPVSEQDLIKEVSWSETDVLQSYLPFANNPDPIVRSKGLKIYREMMQDDQVKVCVDVRIQARLSTPWEIVPGTPGNAQSEEMAAFVKECLLRMRGNFETDIEQMYSAIVYGFSISEKVFEYVDSGRFKGKIGLKAIKTREPFNYDFKVDAHGNLLGLIYIGMTGRDEDNPQTLGTAKDAYRTPPFRVQTGSLNSLSAIVPDLTGDKMKKEMGSIQNPFPPQKFIVYPYSPQFGNWYGRSDLLAAFKWWLMKKHGTKFWAVWLERYASPFIWAQYKRDAGLKKEALLAIDDFIRNLSTRQGARVSDAIDLNALQFSGQGSDSYEKAIEAYNRYIAHAILFPNLLGFTGAQGSSGGSYSLGQKQFDSFMWILNKMGRDMSETVIGEQIIKQLIEINYGEDVEMEAYPKFRFISIEDASIDVRSQIIQRLAQAGMVSQEEEWVRDFLTLPKKDPDIVLPPAQKPGFPGQQPWDNLQATGTQAKAPAADAKKPDAVNPPKNESKMAEFRERKPDEFEEKIKVKAFKANLDRMDEGLFSDAAKAIEAMRDDIISKVQRKSIISGGDLREAQKLNVNAKDLNDAFSKWLVKIFLDAKLAQLEEMGRAGLDVEITKKFSESSGSKKFSESSGSKKFAEGPSYDWEPLPPQEAVDFFRRKVIAKLVTVDGTKKAIDLVSGADITFLKNRAFTITGIVRDDILNDAKQVILNGIKRVDEPGAIKDLKNLFNRYLEQGVAVDGDLLVPHRLNTIVRTNVTEALNEGRAAMIEDPDVGDFVQFWMYSAIIDERTTDYCRCMDGKIFRVEDMRILKPGAHYNCRSILIPITQFEVERKKQSGEGIEIGEPCPGRMDGFTDAKRDTMQIVNDVPPPAQSESKEIEVRKQLEDTVTSCPYSKCHSPTVRMTGWTMNVGQFSCDACGLPFRVSTGGDIYLFDPGAEKWMRATAGLFPSFFRERK